MDAVRVAVGTVGVRVLVSNGNICIAVGVARNGDRVLSISVGMSVSVSAGVPDWLAVAVTLVGVAGKTFPLTPNNTKPTQ